MKDLRNEYSQALQGHESAITKFKAEQTENQTKYANNEFIGANTSAGRKQRIPSLSSEDHGKQQRQPLLDSRTTAATLVVKSQN